MSFGLSSCSSLKPTPDSSPVTLVQVLERWHKQRQELKFSSGIEAPPVKDDDPISLAIAGQFSMVMGDMQSAVKSIHQAIDINNKIDIPHYLLADVMYRLAFFDLVDRGLCEVTLTPIQNIPESQLRNGHLQIEIIELVNAGRPVVYHELLSSQGIEESEKLRIQFYVYSLVQDMIAGQPDIDETLQMLGGPPEKLPVPDCKPDQRSMPFLRQIYNEILLAQKSEVVETPGVLIVQKDRISNLAVRLQVLLGDEIVPLSDDGLTTADDMQNLPPVLPSTLTQDPELVAIIYAAADTMEAAMKDRAGGLDLYGDLFSIFEDQLSQHPTDLMARLNLAYMYQRSYQYHQALDHYIIAAGQAPDMADPLIGLGRIYYDVAIFDMLDRGLTKSDSNGLTVFYPDEQTKKILQLAKEILLTSKQLERIVQTDENGNQTYISEPGTEDQFLEMIEHHLTGN